MAVSNAFAVMEFPLVLRLDEASVRERFQALSKSRHPDAGGQADDYQQLVEARDILSNPARRLRHWAELMGANNGRGPVVMDAATGEQFARTAGVLAGARQATEARAAATSALARAVAEHRCLAATSELQDLLSEIAAREAAAMGEIDRIAAADQPDPAEVASLAGRLAYLAKWREEARESLARMV